MTSPPAHRRASLKDVARAARVSTATVSYVLSGKRPVAEPTRRRVLRAVEELGYRKNLSAAALRGGHSQAISLIIPDVTNPFYTELIAGAEDAASARDATIELRNANLDPTRERSYLRSALASDCAAIIHAPLTPGSLAPLTDAAAPPRPQPPLIIVDEPVSGPAAASVSVDNRTGGRLVAEHFAATGRRRAGVIGAPTGMPTSTARVEGFVERARELGLVVPPAAVATAVRRTGDAVADAVGIMLADRAIDCFFAGDDLLAARLLRVLPDAGIRIPRDVAVCGFDDIPWAELLSPSLTTVAQPARELGGLAVEAASDLLAGREVHDVVLPVRLVVRESTARAPER